VEGRFNILKAQTRNFVLAHEVDLHVVAEQLPDSTTGADIGAVVSRAFSIALERKLVQLEEEGLRILGSSAIVESNMLASYINSLSEEQLGVFVSADDFSASISRHVPSIGAADLQHYERLRAMYEDSML
jgi:peroxin-6